MRRYRKTLKVQLFYSFSGILAFCPDNFPVEKEPVSMQRFLVTMHDLVDVRIQGVKLVVLSSGQGWSRTSAQSESAQLDLPTVLLTAGVCRVVDVCRVCETPEL